MNISSWLIKITSYHSSRRWTLIVGFTFDLLILTMLIREWNILSQAFSAGIDFGGAIRLILGILGGFFTNLSLSSQILFPIAAFLTSHLVFTTITYIKARRAHAKVVHAGAKGLAGIIASTLGLACAACGAAIIAPTVGLLGATGFIVALPFHGQEFLIIGTLILLWSNYKMVQDLKKPPLCDI